MSSDKNSFVELNLTNENGDVVEHIETRVLVAGDGANSSIRKQAHMPTWGLSYG